MQPNSRVDRKLQRNSFERKSEFIARRAGWGGGGMEGLSGGGGLWKGRELWGGGPGRFAAPAGWPGGVNTASPPASAQCTLVSEMSSPAAGAEHHQGGVVPR